MNKKYTVAAIVVRSGSVYEIFKEVIVLNPTRFEGMTITAVVDMIMNLAGINFNDGISREYVLDRILAFVKEHPGTGIVWSNKETA